MPIFQNRFKVTMSYTIGETTTTIETDRIENWIGFTPTIERHPIYKTLFSTFSEGALTLIKDAKDFVDAVYSSYGGTLKITMQWAEWSYDSQDYTNIYSLGQLDLTKKYKRNRDRTEVGFEPTDFIMKTLNRDEVVTSLQKLTDMDGVAITPFTNETISIDVENQIIEKKSVLRTFNILDLLSRDDYSNDTLYVPIVIGQGIINEDAKITINELSQYVEIQPSNQFSFQENGTAVISFDNLSLRVSLFGYDTVNPITASLAYRVNIGSEVVLDSDTYPLTGDNFVDLSYTGQITVTAVEGTGFILYVKLTNLLPATTLPSISIFTQPSGVLTTYITQQTTYDTTSCEFMFPWEFLLRLCQQITGRDDCLRSSVFGRTDGEVYQYDEDGEYSLFALSNVKQLRGFPIAQHPINASLQGIFKSLDAIFCLGLGVVYEDNVPYIIVEKLTYFYDKSSVLLTVNAKDIGIEWSAALKYAWGSVEGGYSKYSFEESPTLNSPHSPRTYTINRASEFLNGVYNCKSEIIASGHLIELLRRLRYTDAEKKDTEYDESIIIMEFKRDGSDFVKVNDEDFDSVTNIDNPTTNSNLNISPARNMLRHAPFILCVLAKRIKLNGSFDEYLRFQSGEANLAMETVKDVTTTEYRATILVGTPEAGEFMTGYSGMYVEVISVDGSALVFNLISGTVSSSTESFYTTGGEFISVSGIEINATPLIEGGDIARSQVQTQYQEPLFDSSEMGTCSFKLTRTQRTLLKEGIIARISVIDGNETYTGFIETIKEKDLNNSEGQLSFLLTSGLSPHRILEENGNFMLEERGNIIMQEQSEL